MQPLTQFAHEETEAVAEKADIFTSLGIDWQMLILQLVGFLLLVFILSRWVYPWLMKSVDERQEKIEAASKAAEEAKQAAANAEEKTAELLEVARKEAADIVNTARLESAAAIAAMPAAGSRPASGGVAAAAIAAAAAVTATSTTIGHAFAAVGSGWCNRRRYTAAALLLAAACGRS